MPVFDSNCLYIIQCLALCFLRPLHALCGRHADLWAGVVRAAHHPRVHLRLLGLPRCGRCRYWATVQCPLYGRNTPDDFCSRGERWGD